MNNDSGMAIRVSERKDAGALAAIYNHYVKESTITFEEEPVTAAEMARRVEEVQSASFPWLIAESEGRVAGYAYATHWKLRSAYRFSVEITVYIAPAALGQGIGSMLYEQLFNHLQVLGVHVVIGGIALPNPASIALHEKFGLRKVAHFQEGGFKFGRWIDVGYWQRTF